MKKFIAVFVFCIALLQITCAQPGVQTRPQCSNVAFDEEVASQISFSIPLIGVQDLAENPEAFHIFDTRKKEEYQTSHIPGAKYLGYRDFDITRLEKLPFDSPIVLYCSIGYRSEKIGEKLRDAGFTRVYNLYGSIFDWVNRGCTVVDENGIPTEKVHTYSRSWSKWVEEGKAIKVW